MSIAVQAVFENGILRPLQPLKLAEHQQVQLTIEDDTSNSEPTQIVLAPEAWDAFLVALDSPPRVLPQLRKLFTSRSGFNGPASTE